MSENEIQDTTVTTEAPVETAQVDASVEAPAETAAPAGDAPVETAPVADAPVEEAAAPEPAPDAGATDTAQAPADAPAADAPAASENVAGESSSTEEPAGNASPEPEAEAPADVAVEAPAAEAPVAEAIVGSVVETQPAAPEPVVNDVPAQAAAPTTLVGVPLLQADDAITQQLEGLKYTTDAYVAKMGAAIPVSPAMGAQHQQGLFRHIESILKLEGTVFTRAWSDLLAKAHAEREGAFHESRVFRFFDQVKMDVEQSRVFQNLLHLVIHTADPKSRRTALEHLDLGSVTTGLTIPGASDKLIGFYSPQ